MTTTILNKTIRTTFRVSMLALLLAGTCGAASTAFGSPRGASPDEGKNLTRAQYPLAPAVPGECNRECLYQFVDKYFDAMLSRCWCNLAVAPEAKYTENEVPVKLGEGMWKTFSGRGTYRVYLADPASGEAGYYGTITEDNGLLEGVIALRMRIRDHRVTELETITVREQKRPKGGLGLNTAGIMTPRTLDELDPKGFVSPDAALLAPLGAAETREQLIGATNGYFEAYAQGKGSAAPLDAQCARRENGLAATNNSGGPAPDKAQPSFHMFSESCAGEIDRGYVTSLEKVRDARPLVVDEKQGLVLDLAFFDNQGDLKSIAVAGVGNVTVPAEYRRAFSFMAPQLFKIESGRIREIEGLSWAVPFGEPPAAWGR
ncbi:MAG TPA: hypothetical protein VK757_03005 [Candidatus Acidoferrum sp.]|jgi:hypothetical protein|nr:hypothetical protein [Candidatus Acidoferrum sp.]